MKEQIKESCKSIEITPDSISEYTFNKEKRRQAGLPLLDKPTVTRFVQYPEKNIGGGSVVPYADVDVYGQLYLNGTNVDDAWGDLGVRRVVRVA